MENKNVKIAVLSGKGGTGKTLVSVNLTGVAEKALYVDCDVEEPNGHLFFKPKNISEKTISVKIPAVNKSLCVGCRKCVDFCNFNALAFIKTNPSFLKRYVIPVGAVPCFVLKKQLQKKISRWGLFKRVFPKV